MEEQPDITRRLARIEERLDTIERVLGVTPAPAATAPAETAPRQPAATPGRKNVVTPSAAPRAAPRPAVAPATVAADDGGAASRWMAWGAAIAFLLAAIYLLRLVYDSGWLTPPRQVSLALLGGIALIVTGLAIARIDRLYAAYLPAAGTVVLYITAYAAHLYYGLIGRGAAIAAISLTSVAALWLGRRFSHSVFPLLAVLGTYLFPLWLAADAVAIGDFVLYFAAWSLVFAIASVAEGRRTAYVLSMFGGLISFQVAWKLGGNAADWAAVALFQCYLFVLSAITAVAFSLIHNRPLNQEAAAVHGIALFYFYALEYALLRQHAPHIVDYVALGSALVVLGAYLLARRALPAEQRGAGATLVSSYCAVVTAHILVFEWVPGGWLPWAALLAPLAVPLFTPLFRDTPRALGPVRVVSLVVFAAGFVSAVITDNAQPVPLPDAVLFAYAAALYGGYALAREKALRDDARSALLYAAHVSAMLACSRLFDTGFGVSLSWALLALGVLAAALALRDRNLGKSSLLVFAASAAKVLLIDLNGADSLLRVLSLLVVGISLYAGGWLYQRMFHDPEQSPTENRP